jgi:hypothetical protein
MQQVTSVGGGASPPSPPLSPPPASPPSLTVSPTSVPPSSPLPQQTQLEPRRTSAVLLALLTLCDGMRAPMRSPSAFAVSRLAGVRMGSPLPPPVPGTLGNATSAVPPAAVPFSQPTASSSSSGASTGGKDGFSSMFGDSDDELAIAKESLMSELGDGLSAMAADGDARKVRARGTRGADRARGDERPRQCPVRV